MSLRSQTKKLEQSHHRQLGEECDDTPMWWYGMHCRALDAPPWQYNKVFAKQNATLFAKKIDETYQTDFWFYARKMELNPTQRFLN